MQVMGFSLVGIGTYWHLVRTGAMSAEESLAAMVGISSLGNIFWAVMHAGALKQDPTGAGIQVRRDDSFACLLLDICVLAATSRLMLTRAQ